MPRITVINIKRNVANLATKKVNRERNGGTIINVRNCTQKTAATLITKNMNRERFGGVTVNMMNKN